MRFVLPIVVLASLSFASVAQEAPYFRLGMGLGTANPTDDIPPIVGNDDPNGAALRLVAQPSSPVSAALPWVYPAAATGGTQPYAFEVEAGSASSGFEVSIDESSGIVSAIGPSAGDYEFTLRVTDASGDTDEDVLTASFTADGTMSPRSSDIPLPTIIGSPTTNIPQGDVDGMYDTNDYTGVLLKPGEYVDIDYPTPIKVGTFDLVFKPNCSTGIRPYQIRVSAKGADGVFRVLDTANASTGYYCDPQTFSFKYDDLDWHGDGWYLISDCPAAGLPTFFNGTIMGGPVPGNPADIVVNHNECWGFQYVSPGDAPSPESTTTAKFLGFWKFRANAGPSWAGAHIASFVRYTSGPAPLPTYDYDQGRVTTTFRVELVSGPTANGGRITRTIFN